MFRHIAGIPSNLSGTATVPEMSESTIRLPVEFIEILERTFGDAKCATGLFQEFLTNVSYSSSFAASLIDVAQGKRGDSWEVRRFATLLLQDHLLSLSPSDTQEFKTILQHLGLRSASDGLLPNHLLKEGYSCSDLPGFIREFRRRLGRPRCAVQPRGLKRITSEDVCELVFQSRQECKLVLARYMFAAEEVVARVHRHSRLGGGVHVATTDSVLQNETALLIASLPDYEGAILRKMQSSTTVYWVANATPSELNSLVEYPLGTVVLVVKPPGSHFEFELKRVGRRGNHPLSVRSHVPASHRLDGGSMISALEWDAEATAVLNQLYRHIHNEPAPISRIVQILGKSDVPVHDRECPILEYLTHQAIYGEHYAEMREAMAIVVDCFRQERGNVVPSIQGEYGLTAQFLAFTGPAQATLCGSSSFRLDLVAKYLSVDGPDEYFRRGLHIEYQAWQAKRLADDLLDEVLGVYHPPDVKYQDHDQYVAAALAIPKNRARANAVYVSLLEQIGKMWGTLLALRGYSFGESFVARNVGVRTIWNQGKWCVRLVFQDHDNLVLPDESQVEYWFLTALSATSLDDRYINGHDGNDKLDFELNSLQRIYRVDDALREKGCKRLRSALKHAHAKTQLAMQSDTRVKSRFNERFVDRLREWDAVARIYLARHRSSNAEDWKRRVEQYLHKRGYDDASIAEHCGALEKHGSFVDRYPFLFRARRALPSSRRANPVVVPGPGQAPGS